MPIDASIPLQAKAPIIENNLLTPFEQAGQLQHIQSGRNKLLDYQKGKDKENKLAQILKLSQVGGKTDFDKLQSGLGTAGMYEEQMGAQQQQQQMQKSDVQMQQAKIETALGNIDYLSRLFSTVQDQAGQDAAIMEAEKLAPGSSEKIPKVYSPEGNKALIEGALTHKDRLQQQHQALAQQNSDRTYQASRDDQRYREQNDALNRQETARGHDITSQVGNGANAVLGGKQMFEAEQKLGADHKAESKTFELVRDAHSRLNSALPTATTSAASTLAGATTFMKLLDPGSVVRESELGMALAATGAIDRMTNYYNTLKNGKVLTQSQVQDFKDTGDKLFAAAELNQKKLDSQYLERAKSYGMNPKNVITNYSDSATPSGSIRTQTNKTTGQRRQSTDGGKTWELIQ